MFSKTGEISTLVVLGVLSIIGVATLISSTTTMNKNTIATRAEYDGTSCNDNIGDSLNACGSTSFTINCWGKLDRAYSYVLFWCPEKSKGATYCGDPRDLNSGQATVLDRGGGAAVPSTLSKNTDKTCGCVQWDVGVGGATAQDGVAGGAIMCANNPCDDGSDDDTDDPGNEQNTPTMTPFSCRPGEFKCPDTGKCVADQGECRNPTATPTPGSCRSGLYKCPDGRCMENQSECRTATSTPTKKPTPTPTISQSCSPNQKKCPGSNVCQPIDSICQATPIPTTPRQQNTIGTPNNTPTPTSSRQQVTLGTPNNNQEPTVIKRQDPTPAPTTTLVEKFRTENETIINICTKLNISNCFIQADKSVLINTLNSGKSLLDLLPDN